MNIFGKLAVSALVLSVASVASAASVSGGTDFRVKLPEILVLYHWEDAYLELTADNSVVNSDVTRELESTLTGGTYNFNTNSIDVDAQSSTNPLANNIIDVTLTDSWAVRSLSTGNVKLTLTNPNPILKDVVNGTSEIIISEPNLVYNSTEALEQSIPSGWTAVKGDIKFKLDLSAATKSGEHNARGVTGKNAAPGTNDTFLLTLTGN
ncbi:hypothetical protein [Psychrobacter sp. DAB_AL32B]|uniref:hypothetical protein n=1 Tax=Psychrobacter sp. DAB_AL32B TaxID=1028414 RepID=UPI000B7DAB67|nr:hypothetical protein [Psychrobacter sp. DAB_AL32B]OXL18121.1 hypothetical protein CAN34_12890 [Psychrobacter sp. DAB_AL32B]